MDGKARRELTLECGERKLPASSITALMGWSLLEMARGVVDLGMTEWDTLMMAELPSGTVTFLFTDLRV